MFPPRPVLHLLALTLACAMTATPAQSTAAQGNVAQMGWLDPGRPTAQSISSERQGPEVSTPLWPALRLTADEIINTGPRTMQERREENDGYSPSTIAAEIADLADQVTWP